MAATGPDLRFVTMVMTAVVMASLCGTVWAADMTVKMLSLPEFDESGQMTRRLKAETATSDFTKKSQLKNGSFDFYDARSQSEEPIATLDFKDATYDRPRQIVEGDGHVVLHSAKGDVAGHGFVYDVGGNHLLLKSAVSIDHNGVHLAGNSGEVFFVQTPSASEALIKEATLKGGIVMSGKLDPNLDFEKAECERASYAASNEMITLDSPVYFWRKGIRRRAEGAFTIFVGKRSATAAASEVRKTPLVAQPD